MKWSWTQNNLSEKKGEGMSKASQKKSEKSRPLSGKESYDRVRFPDRLQNNSHFMEPIGNRLVPSMLTAVANRKIAPVKIFL